MTQGPPGSMDKTVLALCGLAARRLGWRPHEFWRATPAELATALGLDGDAPPLIDRASLARLMEDENDRRIR